MQNNQWNDANLDNLIEEAIIVVMTFCESDFCQIDINFLNKRWDNSHTKVSASTSNNLALITDFTLQQKTNVEVFNLTEDSRFNKQKVMVNDQHIKHFFGIPLITKNSLVIGFICIMNNKPKQFSEHQKLMAKILARDILLHIELVVKDNQLNELAQLRSAINKELDEFTYIASHDLVSPLNAIKNIVTWVEEDTNAGITSDNPKYFEMIKNSIARMHCLLKNLANYSRISRCDAKPEHLHLKTIIAECRELDVNTNQFEFQINDCELELPKPPLLVVFKHLISNAIKHHHESSGLIQIDCVENPAHYQLSIMDNGPGIAPEHQEKIFLPFQTLKPKDEMEGSGLGLAIVKKTLGLYRGNIAINSELGAGATFTIVWPKSATKNN